MAKVISVKLNDESQKIFEQTKERLGLTNEETINYLLGDRTVLLAQEAYDRYELLADSELEEAAKAFDRRLTIEEIEHLGTTLGVKGYVEALDDYPLFAKLLIATKLGI